MIYTATSTSGASAVIILPALATGSYGITDIQWSYSGNASAPAPATIGTVTVADGVATLWTTDVTNPGPGAYNFGGQGIGSHVNSQTTITIVGVSGCIGKINASVFPK